MENTLFRVKNIIENYLCKCFIARVTQEMTAGLKVIFTTQGQVERTVLLVKSII